MIDLGSEIRKTKTNYYNELFLNSSDALNSGKNKINNDSSCNTFSNNKNKDFSNVNKEEYIPRSYNVIFSSNPQSGLNSKK